MQTRDVSNRVNKIFAASARNLTPASVRHAARILYVPVSHDPEVIRHCTAVLSDAELEKASRLVRQDDEYLFKQRRAFRRYCGALVLGSSRPLRQVNFDEMERGRPFLAEIPDVWFSFSSCRFGFLAAWSATHGVGIDIEDQTRGLEAAQLAQYFFTAAEARRVTESGGKVNLQTFFHFWSLKEAALKSIGEGLPYGLDAFEFELNPIPRVTYAPPDYPRLEQFTVHLIRGTGSCIALVLRNPA